MLGFPARSWFRVAREGAWALGGQVAVAAAGLVAIRLLTELAPKEVFGEASLVLGAMMLGRQVFLGPVMSAQLRFHPEYRNKGQARWFSREIARIMWLSAGLFAAVGACAFLVWRTLEGGSWRPILALALAGILVTDVAKVLRLNRLNAERRQGRYALWMGAQAWLWPALSALFLLLWTSTESYLAGQVAGSALALVIFGMIFYPRIAPDAGDSTPEPRRAFLSRMLAYGLPFVLLAFVGWAAHLGDRYILAGFMGKADVGLYAAAYSVASRPFLLADGGLALLARPVLFEAESSRLPGKARKVFALWMLAAAGVGALGVLAFWLFGDWVVWLLLAKEYREGATAILPWVALGYGLLMVGRPLRARLLSLERSAYVIWPVAAGAITSVAISLLLVPVMGPLGAARAKAAGFGVHLLAVLWIVVRCTGARRFGLFERNGGPVADQEESPL